MRCNIEQKDKKKSKQKNLMDGESRRYCVVIILLLCICTFTFRRYLTSIHISHVSITALLSRVCIIHRRQTYTRPRAYIIL